jgi:hypothetical protein
LGGALPVALGKAIGVRANAVDGDYGSGSNFSSLTTTTRNNNGTTTMTAATVAGMVFSLDRGLNGARALVS